MCPIGPPSLETGTVAHEKASNATFCYGASRDGDHQTARELIEALPDLLYALKLRADVEAGLPPSIHGSAILIA